MSKRPWLDGTLVMGIQIYDDLSLCNYGRMVVLALCNPLLRDPLYQIHDMLLTVALIGFFFEFGLKLVDFGPINHCSFIDFPKIQLIDHLLA